MTDKIDWYSIEGETRRYGVGMVECAYAVGRNEVVHVVTHESVKDIAMQHLPTPQQRTWVGLTQRDIDWCIADAEDDKVLLVLNVQRILKEKNT